jgi:hypothetical protein
MNGEQVVADQRPARHQLKSTWTLEYVPWIQPTLSAGRDWTQTFE